MRVTKFQHDNPPEPVPFDSVTVTLSRREVVALAAYCICAADDDSAKYANNTYHCGDPNFTAHELQTVAFKMIDLVTAMRTGDHCFVDTYQPTSED